MDIDIAAGRDSGTPALRGDIPLAFAARLPDRHDFPNDYAVFIGRMRPVTKAHLANVRHALMVSAIVVVVIGSAEQAPSPRTPFGEALVETMLRGNFSDSENARIVVVAMRDLYNNALWLTGVRSLVRQVTAACGPAGRKPRIALVGHFKDARTSDYLKRFRPWGLEKVANVDGISATPIRDEYWEDPLAAVARHRSDIPENVEEILIAFARTPEYTWLAEEHRAYVKDRRAYDGLRFRPTFHAADPVVIMDGNVLLIERDLRPGLGLLSLPGSFVNEGEEVMDAMLRGLYEKTKIRVPKRIAASRTTATHEFSYPWRSERGRIISTAFLVELDEEELPRVSPGKGAARALWMPLADLDPRRMFEDHMRMVELMVGLMRG